MRIIFMGTPEFAVPTLTALHEAGHAIVAVYTQPPRPAGRGKADRKSPVQLAAEKLGIVVRHPTTLRDLEAEADFLALEPELAVVVAYGLILPTPILEGPRRGCLNVHASLLPRWRGAAPIQRSILAGDHVTGVTIMRMEAGLDTGPMLMRGTVPITPTTTAAALHDVLAELGAGLIVQALSSFPSPVAQSDADATYAPKLTREDGRIDWTQSAEDIDRRIRAFNPWPGTFTILDGQPLKVLAAQPTHGRGVPGTILDSTLAVACGQGALRLTKVQLPGRGVLDAAAFLRGHPLPPGTLLGS